jgi:hypothetical protein
MHADSKLSFDNIQSSQQGSMQSNMTWKESRNVTFRTVGGCIQAYIQRMYQKTTREFPRTFPRQVLLGKVRRDKRTFLVVSDNSLDDNRSLTSGG